jgi:uncharacterized membrane protein YhaH (DUF805 family)
MAIDAERLNFLYRSDQGRIDRHTWLEGVRSLALTLIPFALLWNLLEPYTAHDVATSPFFAPLTIGAYVFLLFYAFIVLLVAVSYVNLSAKRFRDRAMTPPVGLASLVPFLCLLAGAAHWLQPRVVEAMSIWWVWGIDITLIGAIIWTLYELGLKPAHKT